MSQGLLKDKRAIITGAASGIGRATAIRFAEQGALICLADLDKAALAETARLAEAAGSQAVFAVTDVSKEKQVKALVDKALQAFGQVDILVNNAGIVGDLTTLPEQSDEVWTKVYGVNVLGAMHTIKHLAQHMMDRGSGAIVNVASVAGIRSGAGGNAYSASKAALINFTQTAACDLGGFGVRVNAVCPGLIETGMTKSVFDYARAKGKEDKLGARCELRRYGHPEEIANAIAFLASDWASYITGQALPVDGGNTASLNLPGMKF